MVSEQNGESFGTYVATEESIGMPNTPEAPVLAATTEVATDGGGALENVVAAPETSSSTTSASVEATMHPLETQFAPGHWELSSAESSPVRHSARARKPYGLDGHHDDGLSILRSHLQANLTSTPQPALSAPSSTHTSSTSLRALSEESEMDQGQLAALPRAASAWSTQGGFRNRRISNPKSSSTSRSHGAYAPNSDFPIYPDQSYAVLQPQPRSARPATLLRTHSSNPSQNSLPTGMSPAAKTSRDRRSPSVGGKIADNTPISSPGLFSPAAPRPSTATEHNAGLPPSDSPHLHPTHLQTPKETHTAEIEHDLYTGNKLINSYEVLEQLGQGQYGKVKKGRDIENDMFVAIKIVPRYSRQRRLGKLGAAEDRVKKEVAILKKARHQNVVSLLEVIDDPSRQKVYIVLEFVEHGEIKWRTLGLKEIIITYKKHLAREKAGIPETEEMRKQDEYIMEQVRKARVAREHAREKAAAAKGEPFSLELGDSNEDDNPPEASRTASRQTDRMSPIQHHPYFYEGEHGYGLEGTMYGPYLQESYRGRAFSIAGSSMSHISSEFDFEDDDEHSFVPTLTLEKARSAFRDTLLGLEFLHFQGIIHRDIKPANLLEASNGQIKISDFGVSYLGRPVSEEEESKVGETDAKTLDDPRELARTVGTPAFYAPELCSEDPTQFVGCEDGSPPKITAAIDLWALGITLYAMIYGRLPFYTNDQKGLYQVICNDPVFLPKFRLKPVQYVEPPKRLLNPKHSAQPQDASPVDHGKRLPDAYELEEVPESVRNLIAALLTKDPSMRMTIENAKKHPWVVEDIENPGQWIAGTNPRAQGKSKIVVDEKDVSHGVVKRSLVERAISNVSRIAGNLMGRRESRKRATSSTTSASASTESITPTSGSSGSTVGKEQKTRDAHRVSLRGDEVIAAALKASREGAEHPLAQSQTASPVEHDVPSNFEPALLNVQAALTSGTPVDQDERRPRGPDRAISSVSTAESTKTIRAPQSGRISSPSDFDSRDFGAPNIVESAATSIGGIFSGAGKRLAGMRSRERRPLDSGRSPSSSSRRSSSDVDAHASPSLAISTTSVSGDLEPPAALRTESPKPDKSQSRISHIRHLSLISPVHGRRQSYYQPSESSPAAFEQAQEINQRRHVHEAHAAAAEKEAQKEASPSEQQAFEDDCPPSPDDDYQFQKSLAAIAGTTPGSAIQTLPSASTIGSSSTEELAGGISQSTSNPSIPSVVSEASSLAPESFLLPDKLPILKHVADLEPSFMRTAETIKARGHDNPPAAPPRRSLEEQEYLADDQDDGDDEGDSSGDEFLTFGRPARK
jgi:serine/threonine protein kinase